MPRSFLSIGLIFLLIEFFDELNFGYAGAALPSIRSELALTYAQVGLLLGAPRIAGTLVEPVIMLLGDSTLRKRLIIGGGFAIGLSLLLIAGARAFLPLLAALIISYPASGAFVSLSQATLMDLNPGRESHMMARWTVYGSFGNLVGPILLAGAFALGLSWRLPFLAMAGLSLALASLLLRWPFPARHAGFGEHPISLHNTPRWMWDNLRQALRIKALLRWVALLEFGDLMMDVLTSYLALYFADVAGLNPAQTGLVLSLIMLSSLGTDLLLVPMLERYPGRGIVRTSAALAIPLYIAFLVVPAAWAKITLIVAIRFSTIGWYQVLQGEAYAAAPGRSGTVMAINSLAGLLGGALIWLVGTAANQFGLPAAMWLLLSAPIALLLFVPKVQKEIVNPKTGMT